MLIEQFKKIEAELRARGLDFDGEAFARGFMGDLQSKELDRATIAAIFITGAHTGWNKAERVSCCCGAPCHLEPSRCPSTGTIDDTDVCNNCMRGTIEVTPQRYGKEKAEQARSQALAEAIRIVAEGMAHIEVRDASDIMLDIYRQLVALKENPNAQ
jgi:hypothetical protein